MVKVQDKLVKAVECLEYFTTHQWHFNSDNVHTLLASLNQKDRAQFQFDVNTIEWEDYVEKYVLGFRQFLFKQNPSSLEESRKRMTKYGIKISPINSPMINLDCSSFFFRLKLLHQFTKVLLVVFFWRFLMARSKKLRELWSRVIGLMMSFVPRFLPISN